MKKKHFILLFMIMGSMLVFITSCDKDDDLNLPELGLTEIKYISHNSATIIGNLISEDGIHISERGVCWSTSPEPTIEDNKALMEESIRTPVFTSILKDLDAETTYYVRSFATTDDGTEYGSEVTVTTTSPLADIDGNSYKTVVIGNQTWMAANLKTTKFNDGNAIPFITDNMEWRNARDPGMAWWENSANNADRGGYYNWYTTNTGKLCPTGWRVPTENDVNILLDFLGDEPGEKLKSTPTGTFGKANETGFTAYMRGYRGAGNGAFGRAGEWAWYWVDDGSQPEESLGMVMELKSTSRNVELDGIISMETGATVRCIKE